jgi:hypothetical protein
MYPCALPGTVTVQGQTSYRSVLPYSTSVAPSCSVAFCCSACCPRRARVCCRVSAAAVWRPLRTHLSERGGKAILEFESGQVAWGQHEAYLLVLTQETELPVSLALQELQREKGAGIPDLFPVITDEDVPTWSPRCASKVPHGVW